MPTRGPFRAAHSLPQQRELHMGWNCKCSNVNFSAPIVTLLSSISLLLFLLSFLCGLYHFFMINYEYLKRSSLTIKKLHSKCIRGYKNIHICIISVQPQNKSILDLAPSCHTSEKQQIGKISELLGEITT